MGTGLFQQLVLMANSGVRNTEAQGGDTTSNNVNTHCDTPYHPAKLPFLPLPQGPSPGMGAAHFPLAECCSSSFFQQVNISLWGQKT